MRKNKVIIGRLIYIMLVVSLFSSIIATPVLADPGEVYLPLVARKAKTLPPPAPGQELLNGDFESGSIGWTFFNDFGDPILQIDFPRSPTHSARLGILWTDPDNDPSYPRVAYISQPIYVPTDRPILSYYEFINSLEEPVVTEPAPGTCSQFEVIGDWVYVYIKSTLVRKISLCTAVNTPDWTQQQIDLSSYIGSWITLKIEFRSDSTVSSNYYVDDFSLVTP